jgi:hypothetical protein
MWVLAMSKSLTRPRAKGQPRKKRGEEPYSYKIAAARIAKLAAEVNVTPRQFVDRLLAYGATIDAAGDLTVWPSGKGEEVEEE